MEEDAAILYIDNSPPSKQAKKLLRKAGLAVTVRPAPSGYRAAYRTPVLFGLFNRFEGLDSIEVFVENSTLLGRCMSAVKPRVSRRRRK